VEAVFRTDGFRDAVVQGRGKPTGKSYTQFQVRTRHLTDPQQAKLLGDLRARVGLNGQPNIQTVSSSFSSQIARDAIIAIIVSFLLISVYIALRFQWRFAIPILRSLFNDILITMGVYSLSGREVSISTVAAVLTVLGYSIYDTIIVFDRIRENIPLMPKATFAAIANLSIAETLRRSVNTTFITLVPVVSLYVLGGQTLKDFAFALLVGIGLGAFSTIFVATPFLTWLMERSPDFRRRVGSTVVDDATTKRTLRRAAGRRDDGAAPEAEPETEPQLPAPVGEQSAQARREKRRQRRRTRPHGRAR
jgi:SecD/SecF fusion protein